MTTWRTARKIILISASCKVHLESLLVINNDNNKTLTSHDKQQHLYHSRFRILFASLKLWRAVLSPEMAPSHHTAAIENIFLLLVVILIVHIFLHKINFRTIVQLLAWNMPRLYSKCHNIKWMKLIGDPTWGFTLTCISIRKEIDWIVFPSPISSAKMEFCLNSRNK